MIRNCFQKEEEQTCKSFQNSRCLNTVTGIWKDCEIRYWLTVNTQYTLENEWKMKMSAILGSEYKYRHHPTILQCQRVNIKHNSAW